jgi:hypothetical protein
VRGGVVQGVIEVEYPGAPPHILVPSCKVQVPGLGVAATCNL